MTRMHISSHKRRQVVTALGISILIILFLFFIDEAAYNFNWMKHGGNWVAFLIYLSGLTVGQCLAYFVILWKHRGENKLALTNVIGIPLGFVLVLMFFYVLQATLQA